MPTLVDSVDAALARRRVLGLGLLAPFALSACSSQDTAQPDSGTGRRIEHPLGVTDIPTQPGRVIALDSGAGLQTSLQAGVPLIAAETLQGDPPIPPYLPQPGEEFTELGFNEVNFEVLAGLQPDLIIGSRSRLEEPYQKLTEIAPTVAFANTADRIEWVDTVRTVGELLGAAETINSKITDFEAAADRFGEDHAEVLDTVSVALVRFTADEVRILTGVIFGSAVLSRAGITRPATHVPEERDATYISLSQENLDILDDADVIIYFGGGGGSQADSSEFFNTVTGGPLWRRLSAVRDGRAFEVSPLVWWDGYSPAAGLACLDDLTRIVDQL